jgi:biopolymer transport protein ExbD
MKFPRNAKILRSHFDVAPFAAVFFCLLIFLLLGALLPVPGLRVGLQPPTAGNLPGVDRPAVSMAVDAQERLYFENQIVTERQLRASLAAAVRGAREPLTLIVHADKSVSYEKLAWLALLARQPEAGNTNLGITNLLFATLPRADVAPAKP